MKSTNEIKALLEWQWHMGVDETIGEQPINLLRAPEVAPAPLPAPMLAIVPSVERPAAAAMPSLASTIEAAKNLVNSAKTITELREAVLAFDGCALKKTARSTVFDGANPSGSIMIIGEAPDADEDLHGTPFCGAAGKLLDNMLASIGLNRSDHCALATSVFWRPPGGRPPSAEEIAICQPFVLRHIEIVAPKLLILMGGIAAKAVLGDDRSIQKLRGNTLKHHDISVRATFHPSYLLHQPLQKRLAWHDLLEIQHIIEDQSLLST